MNAMGKVDTDELRFLDDDLHWYALLEGAHPIFSALELVYRHIANPEWVAIYQFEPYEGIARVSPLLVKLDQPRDWLYHWQSAFPGLAGSMLKSEQGIEPVASHLRTLVSVRVEGDAESIFRFHDSWIASALYPTLNDTERAKFHGPVCQWLWILDEVAFQTKAEGFDDMHGDVKMLSDGWLELTADRQHAINNGLMSKRSWKEGQR